MAETVDGELGAMAGLQGILEDLTPEARGRVLTWAVSKFGVEGILQGQPGKTANSRAVLDPSQFSDLPSLFAAARPETDMEKVLVGAYWLQVSRGEDEVDARAVNSDLANLGHRVGNVTRAFRKLGELRPALILQTRKTGRSQQATKRYRVTVEGLRFVEKLLSGEARRLSEDEE